MVKYTHKGKRSKTRKKYRKSVREHGAPNVNVMLREFKPGQRVHISVNPSVHEGLPCRRFNGLSGLVVGRQGGCYYVRIRDMRMEKDVIVHPAHLKLQR